MSRPMLLIRRSWVAVVVATVMSLFGFLATSIAPSPAGATVDPRVARGAFATRTGLGFWIVFSNGAVDNFGDARFFGDAHQLNLNGPVEGGTGVTASPGYWLVASDGGIFSYGSAQFYGSMGSAKLNQPVFSMASTRSGHGYYLVARDGGIFAFGDAKFYGSTGGITLRQPIIGIVRHPTGRGYTLVASDGGIFNFGDKGYFGSLPSIGLDVSDVVGVATTASGNGYWIARKGGQVYAFGNAVNVRSYTATACDPVVGIVGNPTKQGYRLITRSGGTVARGYGVGGLVATGTPGHCVP